MTIKKISIKNNNTGYNITKRCVAEIIKEDGKTKTVYFGLANSGGTFFDGATEEKKHNYNNRHSKHENWSGSGYGSAGFYSRWVLWETRNKNEIKDIIKRKTGAQTVTVSISKIKVTKPN